MKTEKSPLAQVIEAVAPHVQPVPAPIASPKSREATVTLWEGVSNTSGERVTATWEALFDAWREDPPEIATAADVDKKRLPGWSPATFTNDSRARGAVVEALFALVLDYDGTTLLEATREAWGRYYGVVHSTPSHGSVEVQREKTTETSDRFRVVLPLARPVTPAEHAVLVAWANEFWPSIDNGATNAERFWYVPARVAGTDPLVLALHGEQLLDPDVILASARATRSKARANTETSDRPAAQNGEKKRDEKKRSRKKTPPGERHHEVVREAARAKAAGLEPDNVRKVVEAANEQCDPPLPSDEVDDVVEWAEGLPGSYALTDLGNAKRFADEHHASLRYLTDREEWLVWTGTHWEADGVAAARRVHETVEKLMVEALEAQKNAQSDFDKAQAAQLKKHAKASQAHGRMEAIEKQARNRQQLAAQRNDLDRDHLIFNVRNGTLDLRTGELRAHRREDLITRVAPVEYDATAECPRWTQFLEEVLPDPEVRAYVQRFIGYALTGEIREHCLPVFWGATGGNGKGTFVNAIKALFGPYFATVPKELLMASRGGPRHPTERTILDGARLVVAAETNQDEAFDLAQVKVLTGGDPIAARKMNKDFYEFDPTHKLVLVTNPKPAIRADDGGMWRRIHLVPWEAQFTESDPNSIPGAKDADTKLGEKLRAEVSGILNWALEGCAEWQRVGLSPPERVRSATTEYRDDEDPLRDFLAMYCKFEPKLKITRADLYLAYVAWARENEIRPMSNRAFAERMHEKLRKLHGRDWPTRTSIRVGESSPRDGWNGVEVRIMRTAGGLIVPQRASAN